MEDMFNGADSFNQPLNAWDVAAPRGRILLARVDRRRPSALFDRSTLARAQPRDLGVAAAAGLARHDHGGHVPTRLRL